MNKILIRIVSNIMASGLSIGAILIGTNLAIEDKNTSIEIPSPEETFPDNEDTIVTPDPEEPEFIPPTTPPEEVEPELPSEPEPETKSTYIRAKTNGLNVRSGPGTNYSSVGYIDKGDMITYVAKNGNWYQTIYKNKTAYISANTSHTELFTQNNHENETVEAVIEEGLKLLGFPYVYGATRFHDGSGRKISGFDATKYDCSSLMQYIFYHGADVMLQMTTRTQIQQGTYIKKENIERGDLLFFTNSQRYNNTGIERVGHVALYLGDNYILHTASDYAVIEQISSTRWGYYLEAKRFIFS